MRVDAESVGVWRGVPVKVVPWLGVVRLALSRWLAAVLVVALGSVVVLVSPMGAASRGVRIALLMLGLPFVAWLYYSARSNLGVGVVARMRVSDSHKTFLSGAAGVACVVMGDQGLEIRCAGSSSLLSGCAILVSRRSTVVGIEVIQAGRDLTIPAFGRRLPIEL